MKNKIIKDPREQLLKLCSEKSISVRFNSKNNSVYLYEDLGEFECAEQALLFIKQLIKEEE